MLFCSITYEDISKVLKELQLDSQPTILKFEPPSEQITNRNFGVKDNTSSTNQSELIEQYSKCSIDSF